MRNLSFHCVFLLLLALLPSVQASAADSTDRLFADAELLQITLTAPFAVIERERDKDREYEGRLSYRDAEGAEVVLDVQLQVRGQYRLRKDICRFPPLWLNFRKRQVTGTLFENQDRLKLAVQCGSQARYRDYLVREQQVYQLFNVLSPYSFKTRLAQISYSDTGGKSTAQRHLGFFIEHQKRLAERLLLTELELEAVPVSDLDMRQANLVALFMFMISNTDYSMISGPEGEECCHNIKLFTGGSGGYIPVPYDFDSTGYVGAAYATPAQELGQRSVRQRLFRGFCVETGIMQDTLALFNERYEFLNRVMTDQTYQSASASRRTTAYVDEFFEIINDSSKLEKRVLNQCR